MMIEEKVFNYLKELSQNNNREWFLAHKETYSEIVESVVDFNKKWIEAVGQQDGLVAQNDSRKAMFRIYRDLRFSKDKTPYKDHIGMAIGRDGRKGKWAGWYLHIEPGQRSFLAGGKWNPDAKELKAIRQEIDYNLEEFLAIIQDHDFQKSFSSLDKDESLINAPKGYEPNHPAIDILKLKAFTCSKFYTDKEVLSSHFIHQVVKDSLLLLPFIEFLNRPLGDVFQEQ